MLLAYKLCIFKKKNLQIMWLILMDFSEIYSK
jgi:hypothetical protein